jgi:hypothetical protein
MAVSEQTASKIATVRIIFMANLRSSWRSVGSEGE